MSVSRDGGGGAGGGGGRTISALGILVRAPLFGPPLFSVISIARAAITVYDEGVSMVRQPAMASERILAQAPFIERIGELPVNIGLGVVYVLLWLWGFVTLLMIPSNPNISWPLSLALIYVLVVGLVHGLVWAVGKVLVPGFVHYPTESRWLYILADCLLAVSFIGILVSYVVSSVSSTAPLFSIFFTLIGLAIYIYKLFWLVYPEVSKWLGRTPKDDSLLEPVAASRLVVVPGVPLEAAAFGKGFLRA
jgi:hypothetical protein